MNKFSHKFSVIVFLFFGATLTAQNIGINATGAAPVASAGLDVNFINKGLLVPRVVLTATNLAGPITAPATSLLVYNTATAGISPNNVTPGYYYWNGTKWIAFGGSGSNDWGLTGNAGTVVGTNFLGTTDNISLAFKTNNIERMRVFSNGNVGIGISTAITPKLEVFSGATANAIYGHSSQVGGYLGREVNISFGTPAQNLSGAGVYAANPSAGYTSSYSQSTGLADVSASISFSNVWMASYDYVENASATFNPSSIYGELNNSSTTLTGNQVAIEGYSTHTAASGNTGFTVGIVGVGKGNSQDCRGIKGYAYGDTTSDAQGGYFYASGVGSNYLYVADNWNNRKATGTGGAVSEVIPTKNHGRIMLTTPESPEYWYQDYGTVQLVNGKVHVDLDPILVDIIIVDKNNPIKVFAQVNIPNSNGVAIINKTSKGFDIVELNGGTHSGEIDYQIIAHPKTNFGEGRFPQGPGPDFLKSSEEPAAAKAANQPDRKIIYRWPSDWDVYGYNPEKLIAIGDVIPSGPHAGLIKGANGTYLKGLPANKSVLYKGKGSK